MSALVVAVVLISILDESAFFFVSLITWWCRRRGVVRHDDVMCSRNPGISITRMYNRNEPNVCVATRAFVVCCSVKCQSMIRNVAAMMGVKYLASQKSVDAECLRDVMR